jgi:hypothetical protein
MQHRSRNLLAALIASGLIAVAGFSGTVAAHDPGRGGDPGHPGHPGTSANPLPSGWAWPSDLKTAAVKSHAPNNTEKPEPSKSPHPTPALTCSPTSTSSQTPAPSAGTAALDGKSRFQDMWDKTVADWHDHYNAVWAKDFCAIDPLRKTLDNEIASRTRELQGLVGQIGKSGLSSAGQATADTELNSLIADLAALKTKVDAETTLAALQADYQTLAGKAHLYLAVEQWARLLVGSQKLIAAGPDLTTLETKIAAEIAAAPAVPETADAQIYLNNMKLAVTDGEALAAPLPAALLAITPSQLADGSAAAMLASINVTFTRASWDLQLARWSATWAEHEINEATATPKPTQTATATPV